MSRRRPERVRNPDRCSHPEKFHYPDRGTAEGEMHRIQRKFAKRPGRTVTPQRVYLCCVRGYCITSQDKKPWEKEA